MPRLARSLTAALLVLAAPAAAQFQPAEQPVPAAPVAQPTDATAPFVPPGVVPAAAPPAVQIPPQYVRPDLRLHPHMFFSFDGGPVLGGTSTYELEYTLEDGTRPLLTADRKETWEADLDAGFVLSLSMTRVWSSWFEMGPRVQWGQMRDALQAEASQSADQFVRIDVPMRGYIPLGQSGLVLAAGGIFGVNGRFPGEETYPLPPDDLRRATEGETAAAGGLHGGPTVELRYYVNHHVGFRIGFDYLLHRVWGDIKPIEPSPFIAFDDRLLTQRFTTAQLTFGVFTMAPR